jgi:hypothetical protein
LHPIAHLRPLVVKLLHALGVVAVPFLHQAPHLLHVHLELPDLNSLVKVHTDLGAQRLVVLAPYLAALLLQVCVQPCQFQVMLLFERPFLGVQVGLDRAHLFECQLLGQQSSFCLVLKECMPARTDDAAARRAKEQQRNQKQLAHPTHGSHEVLPSLAQSSLAAAASTNDGLRPASAQQLKDRPIP